LIHARLSLLRIIIEITMGGGYARKRMHDGHTRLRRRLRLRNKTKDLDQVKWTGDII
jgi:hypothetical protein